jgi:predicted RNA-binding Zn-ribbon protein involved in translation (DUF1610 family)
MGPDEDAPRDRPDSDQELKSKYRAHRCPDCGHEWPNVLLRECRECRSRRIVYIPQGAPIRAEVRALAKEIEEWQERGQPEPEVEAFLARLEEMNKRAGPKLTIGSLLGFDFQDGVALYLVEEINRFGVYARSVDVFGGYRDDRIARPHPDGRCSVARDVAEENIKMWQRYL